MFTNAVKAKFRHFVNFAFLTFTNGSFLAIVEAPITTNRFGSVISGIESKIAEDATLTKFALKLVELLQVVQGPEIFRIGSENDGGYYLAKQDWKNTFLISCGVGEDVSFEQALSTRGVSGLLYDGYVDKLPENIDGFSFIKKYIGSGVGMATLSSVIAEVKATQSFNHLILKSDIEGSEWEVLAEDIDFSVFSQIVIELHWITDIAFDSRGTIFSALEKLKFTHDLIWLNVNNTTGFTVIGEVSIPNLVECTYIRKTENTYKQKNSYRVRNDPMKAALYF